MAGGTHVFDMIKRLKENENLKKNNYFKTKSTYTRIAKSINIDHRQATDLERAQIRRRLLNNRREEIRTFIIASVLSMVLMGVTIFLLFKYGG